MFYKVQHVMDGTVDEILERLATDMQIIENYEGERERVVLHARRDSHKIVVAGTLYEINDASMPTMISGFDEYEGFIFDVSRINDTRSLITGYIAQGNIFIEKLYYTYLARLGAAFNAEWKKEAKEIAEALQKEIEKEQGWHWGEVQEATKIAGTELTFYGKIPNTPEPAQNTQADQPSSIDARNLTWGQLTEIERAADAGDPEAQKRLAEIERQDWYKEMQQKLKEIAITMGNYIDNLFDDHPSKPVFEMMNSLMDSDDPVHRATAGLFDDLSLEDIQDRGAKLLRDELLKSARKLPGFGATEMENEKFINSTGKLHDPLQGLNSTGKLAFQIGKHALEKSEKESAQLSVGKPEGKASLRIPRQPKRLNDWKATWRKVKGRWKGGGNYQELAQLAKVSPETIADIVKAGDAGLLD